MLIVRFLLASSLAVAAWCSADSALTIDFTAEITFVDDTLVALPFVAGTPLSGSLTYDEFTPDSNPDPARGDYLGALKSIRFNIGSLVYEASGGDGLVLPIFSDAVAFDSAVTGPSIGQYSPSFVFVEFFVLGNLLTSDALSTAAELNSLLGGEVIALHFADSNGNFAFEAFEAQDFSFTVVPEPSTAMLFALGLGMLGFGRSKTV